MYRKAYEKGRKARRELQWFSSNPYAQGRGRKFDFVLSAEWERGYRDEAKAEVEGSFHEIIGGDGKPVTVYIPKGDVR